MQPPESQTESKRKITEVIDEVASKLGNTRTVCKKYYVHPTVIAAFEKGSIRQYKSTKNNTNFSPLEYALLKLLHKETTANVLG